MRRETNSKFLNISKSNFIAFHKNEITESYVNSLDIHIKDTKLEQKKMRNTKLFTLMLN